MQNANIVGQNCRGCSHLAVWLQSSVANSVGSIEELEMCRLVIFCTTSECFCHRFCALCDSVFAQCGGALIVRLL